MLKYRGHVLDAAGSCTCCVGDEQVTATLDPTGTGRTRSAFSTALNVRWRKLAAAVSGAVDMVLGVSPIEAITGPQVLSGDTKIKVFQSWIDATIRNVVLETDGSFIRDYIRRGYAEGRAFAEEELGSTVQVRVAEDRQSALQALTFVELQGIAEAVSQAAVRTFAQGVLHNDRRRVIARNVRDRIRAIGVYRSTALVELIIVKAFSEATLDTYQAAGVRTVGLLPEAVAAARDSVHDAKKRRKKKPISRTAKIIKPRGRYGSRSYNETPSERTIQRIRKQEQELAQRAGRLVNVKTAGDKRVCKVCKNIAARGPYKIDKARSLIPAHPRCRCVFVPVER